MLRTAKQITSLAAWNPAWRAPTNSKPCSGRRYCRIAHKGPFSAHSLSKTKEMLRLDGKVPTADDKELDQIACELWIIPAFITPLEEQQLVEEINPLFKKKRYIDTHWDGVITGYKEIEKSFWVRILVISSN